MDKMKKVSETMGESYQRLPKLVRQSIESLEFRLAGVLEDIAAVTQQEQSTIYWERGIRGSAGGIPPRATVTFKLRDSDEIYIQLSLSEDCIHVRANRQISLRPSAGNSVDIFVVD